MVRNHYSPNEKPNLFRKRRYQVGAIAWTLVAVAIVILLVFGISAFKKLLNAASTEQTKSADAEAEGPNRLREFELAQRDHAEPLTKKQEAYIWDNYVPNSGFGVEVCPPIDQIDAVTLASEHDQKLVLLVGGFNKVSYRTTGRDRVQIRWGSRSAWQDANNVHWWNGHDMATTMHIRGGPSTFEITQVEYRRPYDKAMRLRLRAQLDGEPKEIHVVPTHALGRRLRTRYTIEFLTSDGLEFAAPTNPDLRPRVALVAPEGVRLAQIVSQGNLAQFEVPSDLPAGSKLQLQNPQGGLCGILCQIW